jgi:hypothetical protein
VLLVDIETLRAMELAPGIIRENITAEGFKVNGLKVGQKLRAGEVHVTQRLGLGLRIRVGASAGRSFSSPF